MIDRHFVAQAEAVDAKVSVPELEDEELEEEEPEEEELVEELPEVDASTAGPGTVFGSMLPFL